MGVVVVLCCGCLCFGLFHVVCLLYGLYCEMFFCFVHLCLSVFVGVGLGLFCVCLCFGLFRVVCLLYGLLCDLLFCFVLCCLAVFLWLFVFWSVS